MTTQPPPSEESPPTVQTEEELVEVEVPPSEETKEVLYEPIEEEIPPGAPDDMGAMQVKYGGPAMIHPGGDWTLRMSPDVLVAVGPDSLGKSIMIHGGELIPVDLWMVDADKNAIFLYPIILHGKDGSMTALPGNRKVPSWAVFVEPGNDFASEETKPVIGRK